MQITFVMLIFPLIMNAMQYYIIDSFIKDSSGSDYEAAPGDDPEEEEHEGLIRGRRGSDDDGGIEVGNEEPRRRSPSARTKEANPTPLPVEYDARSDSFVGRACLPLSAPRVSCASSSPTSSRSPTARAGRPATGRSRSRGG